MLVPLEKFLSILFTLAYGLTDNYGLSLLALSIMVNLILLPVYLPLEKWKKKKAIEQAPMKKELEAIKRAYKGKERYFYTRAVHRRHKFHPLESVILSLGLLIQIPFFLAAYHMLSHLEALEAVSFLFIADLGLPDGAFHFAGIPINILPLIMTGFNILSAYLYTKESSERIPLWILSAVFLILLYPSPAGLVLYWTANNIFALIKQLPELPKRLKNLDWGKFKEKLPGVLRILYYFVALFAVYLSIISLFYPAVAHPSKIILPSTVMMILFFLEVVHLIILIAQKGKGTLIRKIAAAALSAFILYQFIFGLGFIPDYISTGLEKLSSAGIFKKRIAIFTLQAGLGLLFTFPFIYKSIKLSIKPLGNGFRKLQKGFFTGWEEVFLSAAFVGGACLLWIPVMIYSSLPEQFSFTAAELISANVFPFILTLLLSASALLITPKRWRIVPWLLATTTAFTVFLFAFIIPFDFGFLTGFSLSKSENLQGVLSTYFLDFLIVAAIFILMVKASVQWRKGIVSILLLMNILLAAQGLYALIQSKGLVVQSTEPIINTTDNEELGLSVPLSKNQDNVVVFMMDMMTGGYLFEILKDSPELKETFQGFTWFPNTMAVATNTVAGQPAIMGGPDFAPAQVNRRNIQHSVIEEIGRSYQVMIEKAQDSDLEVTLIDPFAYAYLAQKWPALSKENIQIHSIEDYVENLEENHLAAAELSDEKSINKRLLRAIALFRIVPFGLKSFIYDDGYWRPLDGILVYQSYYKEVLPQWLFLKNLPRLTRSENIKGQYYFITSLLAHHPHALSKEGELLYDRFPDPNERDNRKGRNAYYSAEWSLKILGEWCEDLKRKGLYDNTKIIIVSDHGNYRSEDFAAPVKNENLLSKLDMNLVNHTAFNSILLVKDFNSDGPFKMNEQNMSTADTGSIAFSDDAGAWIESLEKDRWVEGQLTHAWDLKEQTGRKYESFGVYHVSGDFYDIKNWERVDD